MQGTRIFDQTEHWLVEAVVEDDGEAPAIALIEGAVNAGGRDANAAHRLVATIKMFANTHRGQRLSNTRFAALKDHDGLFEFKADQLRLFCCYAPGGRLVLLNGIAGKKHTAQRAAERAALKKAAKLKREVDLWYS